ncbi:hypothetical protein [Nocardia asiatica]|uniref:hypothetical protein n=1 Tax=Nocardia asiatica TaxID=209252 RepID=UPI0024565C82|nr:hypothetical protein [Nocardia asiatica]
MDGELLDGAPSYTYGPRRNPQVLDVADVELGTGPRPGEALALRWCDVDLGAQPQQLGRTNNSVTKRHYIDQPTEAPDFTAAMGRLAG